LKNIKIVISIFVLVFLMTGCDVTYNLKIDKNMNISEKITAVESKEFNDLAHDYLLDRISVIYADKYAGYEPIYKLDYINKGSMMGNSFTKTYKTISDFSHNSSIFNDLVKDYSITQSDNIINIRATINDDLYDRGNLAFTIIPENIKINIDVPFEVTNTNANQIKGNIYTWTIDKNNRSKDINISFDENRLTNHIYILNIGISYVILLVIGIIIALSIISFIIYMRFKNLNKI